MRDLETVGAVCLRGAIPGPAVERLRAAATPLLARIEALRAEHGPWGVAPHLPEGVAWLPTVSSVGLEWAARSLGWAALLEAMVTPDLYALLERLCGGAPAADLDQCWLRRQYAPSLAPQAHFPHAWHQDGGIGYDFADMAQARGPQGLLPLITCWCPLDPAGGDAPGIEVVPGVHDEVLHFERLRDDALPPERWRPLMEPGDLLLITPGTVHRTFVRPEMTRPRTSVELRFVPPGPVPSRMAHERLLTLS